MLDYTHAWYVTHQGEVRCKYCGHGQSIRSEVCHE